MGRRTRRPPTPCVEGERLIVALMRMPAGTGADAHSHTNEQWTYVLEGTLRATIGGLDYEAKPGTLLYIPAHVIHSVTATPDRDGVFFTAKDASHGAQPVRSSCTSKGSHDHHRVRSMMARALLISSRATFKCEA